MLTVRDLFNRVAWENVGPASTRCTGYLPGFREVFEEARSCVPSGNSEEMTISIRWVEDEDSRYYDVAGFVCGSDQPYALELCPFEEWAGFFLEERLPEKMPAPEVVSHILLEMTFFGFSDSAIAATRKELEDEIWECTEHPERCVPLCRVSKKPEAKRTEGSLLPKRPRMILCDIFFGP